MRSHKDRSRSLPKARKPRVGGLIARHWRRAATAAAGVLVIGMGYHVVFGQNGLTAYEHKREESGSLRREATALEKENESFRRHVSRLESDPGAIEAQARQELHYARPGEVIVSLPATENASPSPAK